jgi:hypothetical protein
MTQRLLILVLVLSPAILFSQVNTDTAAVRNLNQDPRPVKNEYRADSTFYFLFNISTTFNDVQDQRINKFLSKYGYTPPQNIPRGLRFELAGIPKGDKMIYSINASTIISQQDIITADLSLGAYFRFYKTKKVWLLAGLAIGEHFDRIFLNGNMPPLFDSLAKKYGNSLSLHRNGLIVEPATKIFWYPVQTKKFQVGLFTGIYYDFDFNSRWRIGYYPKNNSTFKNLRKPTKVSTIHEFSWVFSTGLSIAF